MILMVQEWVTCWQAINAVNCPPLIAFLLGDTGEPDTIRLTMTTFHVRALCIIVAVSILIFHGPLETIAIELDQRGFSEEKTDGNPWPASRESQHDLQLASNIDEGREEGVSELSRRIKSHRELRNSTYRL